MVGSARELSLKPERTDLRRILISRAMGNESVVCNRHKIFRECAVESSESEDIFTDRSLACKPGVLEDKLVAHNAPISERK